MICIISTDSSTSRVSLRIVQRHSTAASKESSTLKAPIIASKSGEPTMSKAGISLSHEAMHSSRRGFDAALAMSGLVSIRMILFGVCIYRRTVNTGSRVLKLAWSCPPAVP